MALKSHDEYIYIYRTAFYYLMQNKLKVVIFVVSKTSTIEAGKIYRTIG